MHQKERKEDCNQTYTTMCIFSIPSSKNSNICPSSKISRDTNQYQQGMWANIWSTRSVVTADIDLLY